MREIKFRAWDKLNKRFEYFDLNDPKSMPIAESSIYFMPKQQFLGLKDKNKKEIFEGDVGKGDRTGHLYEVKWVNENARFEFITRNDVSLGYTANTASKMVEIIGNVWENPELLKEKSV